MNRALGLAAKNNLRLPAAAGAPRIVLQRQWGLLGADFPPRRPLKTAPAATRGSQAAAAAARPALPSHPAAAVASRRFLTSAAAEGPQCIVGKKAPDFSADACMPSGAIEMLALKDLLARHEGVCLVFYPLDFTFVCPTELLAYNANIQQFTDRQWAVVGVSVDSVHCHAAWRRLPVEEGGVGSLAFPLVSDLSKGITRAYGLLQQETIAMRGCVLVDKEQIVRYVCVNDLSLSRSVEETLRVVDMIKHVKAEGTVCPASWKRGEKGLVPSAEGLKEYLKQKSAKEQTAAS